MTRINDNSSIEEKNVKKKKSKTIYYNKTASKHVTTIGIDEDKKPKSGIVSHKLMFISAVIGGLSVINFGFVLEYAAPAIPQLMLPSAGILRLDEDSSAWFGIYSSNSTFSYHNSKSLALIGALAGGLISGHIMENYGRQSAIILISVPSSVGWLCIMYAQSIQSLYIGRVLTGLSVGMATMAYPVYIAEISTAQVRGFFGSFFQIGVTIGYVLGAGLALGQIIATLLGICMMFMPETPRWLLSQGYKRSGLDSLQRLRGTDVPINYELSEIQDHLDNIEPFSYLELFSTGLKKPFLLSIGLISFQQLCGINAVLPFCIYIFNQAGFDNSNMVNLIASLSQLVTSIAVSFFVDRLGRVLLLTFAAAAMSITCFAFGLYFQLTSLYDINLNWLALISIFVYFVAFNSAWGSLPLLVISEILPSRARGAAGGLCTCFGWSVGFGVSYVFIPLSNAISSQGAFWVFSALNLLGALFVYFFVPETKGKTLEEIEYFFNSKKTMGKRVTEV
ncbi:uncharacterized protein TRIADDRAFT_61088 [Trichoplax adhaerens]|uniref:Major facilitator superfamily (MFS) profile domain-containing protein n=1 Tax=Trichoplax adhaerens TaxID=10228 RepID=B3SA03_TRIAD|nr:hypothetical protein TRIADDRAFT_61088 [Trichoplax adhaerens]EDV20427.1 hypothetical protein TRIADDRAFT_61088 [Trichoplax adhaerens]|eukprot:XP_002117121.1 hypothetical protein TRIADDRAFT_61088 [Trichoplax adhaerens]